MVKLHFSPTYTPPPPPSDAPAVLLEIVPPCMVKLGAVTLEFVVLIRNTPPPALLPASLLVIVPPYMVKDEPVLMSLCEPISTPFTKPVIVPP